MRIKTIAAALAACLATSAITGCSFLTTAIPMVAEIVSDGMLILDTIDGFVRNYFKTHPAGDAEAKFATLMQRARLALIVAEKALSAARDLTESNVVAALADFNAAYQDLMALVAQFGVREGTGFATGSATGLVVPPPRAALLAREAKR